MPAAPSPRFTFPVREVLLGVALLGSVATLAAWQLAGADIEFVVARALSVLLVVSPFATVVATRVSARREQRVLDDLRVHSVDAGMLDVAAATTVVVFDTAGTLTAGTPTVSAIVPALGGSAVDILAVAASAEFESPHPLGRAIVAEARAQSLVVAPPTGFTTLEGRGVRSTVAGQEVLVGSGRLVAEQGLRLDESLSAAAHAHAAAGATVLVVIVAGQIVGLIAIADPLRTGAHDAVARLRALKVRVAMLTGAPLEVSDWLSVRLGLDEVFAGVLPQDKPDVVSRLQHRGARVLAVGDSIDDGPTLDQADVGVALGADAGDADIRIAGRDPRSVADLLEYCRARVRGRRRRLAIIAGYHAVTVPIAAGVLAGVGILMPPVLALALSLALLGGLALDAGALRARRRP